ncbi:hypothetical protein [Fodinibius saliphilus]|uniref:hypothetical protein n=1 Tax=Fodinibius saliphilus TaxID=1920650 RepID=UPI00110805C4|nr:hypothetical protein [Fodinibius saliphilus]
MLNKISFLLFLIFLSGCYPSKKVINLDNTDRIAWLNNEIKNKQVKINPLEGEQITTSQATISADSLFYQNSTQMSIPLLNVRSIIVSPKFSTSSIISFSLLGIGTYQILTAPEPQGWECTKCPGVAIILGAVGVTLIGNTVETDIYYFNNTD